MNDLPTPHRASRPASVPRVARVRAGAAVLVALGASRLLVACSTPTPPAAVAPAPTPSASPPIEVAADPRVVRCGVDDQPRSVVSELSAEEQTSAFAADARQKARMVMLPPAARRPMPKPRPTNGPHPMPAPTPFPRPRPIPFERPQPTQPAPPPDDRAEPPAFVEMPIQLESRPRGVPAVPPSGSVREVASSLEDLRPALAECTQILDAPPVSGMFTFDVRLSQAGQALSITPAGAGQPSVYERCLLEHACRLRTPALDKASLVTFDVRTFRDEPPPPVPPPPVVEQNPHIGVDVRLDVDPRGPGGLAQRAFSEAAMACRSVGTIGSGAQVIIRGGAPSNRIQQLTTRGVDGRPPTRDAGISCVVAHLRRSLDGRVASPRIVGTVRWVAR